MGWIFVDKDSDGGSQMRQQMRRSMIGGYRYDGYKGDMYHDGYREGYKHGWEDKEEDEEDYRRSRDSKGRYM